MRVHGDTWWAEHLLSGDLRRSPSELNRKEVIMQRQKLERGGYTDGWLLSCLGAGRGKVDCVSRCSAPCPSPAKLISNSVLVGEGGDTFMLIVLSSLLSVRATVSETVEAMMVSHLAIRKWVVQSLLSRDRPHTGFILVYRGVSWIPDMQNETN